MKREDIANLQVAMGMQGRTWWATACPDASGKLRRVVSKHLPWREHRSEAEADLLEWLRWHANYGSSHAERIAAAERQAALGVEVSNDCG